MSLYNHIANKDDLLDGMVDAVFSEVELPGRSGLEDGHARAIHLDAGGHDPAPAGRRPDGVPPDSRSRDPSSPRCRHWLSAGRGFLDPAGRPRILRPRQLHLRVCSSGTQSAFGTPKKPPSSRRPFCCTLPTKEYPPRRADHGARPPARTRLRQRVRLRPRTHSLTAWRRGWPTTAGDGPRQVRWPSPRPRPAQLDAAPCPSRLATLGTPPDVAALDVAGPGVAVVGASEQLDGEAVPGDLLP